MDPKIVSTMAEEDDQVDLVDPLEKQIKIERVDGIWDDNFMSRNHSVQLPINSARPFDYLKHKKVNIALHPELNIMVTSGSDQHIFFWDTEDFRPFYKKNYRRTPTCIKFTPDGN